MYAKLVIAHSFFLLASDIITSFSLCPYGLISKKKKKKGREFQHQAKLDACLFQYDIHNLHPVFLYSFVRLIPLVRSFLFKKLMLVMN